jgi:hypothetical protein
MTHADTTWTSARHNPNGLTSTLVGPVRPPGKLVDLGA